MVRIEPGLAVELAIHHCFDEKLLAQLPDRGLGGGLTLLHLSAREFPLERIAHPPLPLAGQDLPVAQHNADGDLLHGL